MSARWTRPSNDAAWKRDARTWTPYTPTITAVRFGTNEVQTLTVTATEGTFTVTFEGETTAEVAFNVSADDLLGALIALTNINEGDVAVTLDGTVYTITFRSSLARDVEELTVDTSNLGGTAEVETVSPGGTAGDEVTLSTNGTHKSEGWFRQAGLKLETRGEIAFGDDPADTDTGGWWLFSLPEAPAAYRQAGIEVIFQQRATGVVQVGAGVIQTSTDGTVPTGFLVVLDGGSIAAGTNPAQWGVPFTPAAGDTVVFWATYEPDELET